MSIILRGSVNRVIVYTVPKLSLKANIPIVVFNLNIVADYDSMYYDINGAVKDAALHLSELRYKKIGFVGELYTQFKLNHKKLMTSKNLYINEYFIYIILS